MDLNQSRFLMKRTNTVVLQDHCVLKINKCINVSILKEKGKVKQNELGSRNRALKQAKMAAFSGYWSGVKATDSFDHLAFGFHKCRTHRLSM